MGGSRMVKIMNAYYAPTTQPLNESNTSEFPGVDQGTSSSIPILEDLFMTSCPSSYSAMGSAFPINSLDWEFVVLSGDTRLLLFRSSWYCPLISPVTILIACLQTRNEVPKRLFRMPRKSVLKGVDSAMCNADIKP